MSAIVVGLALALVASVALNSAYTMQHVGSAAAPAVDARRPLATLRALLRSRLWAAGAVVGMTGWALHIGALSQAPLSMVQAFVAGGLGLYAPVAARLLGQPLATLDWAGVVGVVLGLTMLCFGLRNPGIRASVYAPAAVVFVVAAFALAGGLTRAPRSWRPQALGLAGGILYGAADLAIKALTAVAHRHGLGAALLSPWILVAAAATAAAFFCFQRGLQSGRAVPVIVLMTAATTAVSILGGFAVFGDPLGSSPAVAALHVSGFVLVAVAAAALAPVSAREPVPARRPQPRPARRSPARAG